MRADAGNTVSADVAGSAGNADGSGGTLDRLDAPPRQAPPYNRPTNPPPSWTAVSSDPTATDDREVTYIEFDDVEVEVSVWEGMSGWNANAVIDERDYRAMGAATREDALTRLQHSIQFSTEATFALGIKNRRYWSPNPYWKGR